MSDIKILPNTERPIKITGGLCPFHPSPRLGVPDQPVLITLPNTPDQYWAVVFSDVEKLRAEMERIGIENYKVKQIDDGQPFAESIITAGVRIMLNPRIIDGVKTRWTEIVLDELEKDTPLHTRRKRS